jgi:zinc protease
MRLRGRISLRHPREPVREVLPNGVVLIAQEHRASDVVALQLWMRMGGRDEAAGELGLAHYIEHMLFKGTPTRPPGSIDAVIEGFGGASSAFTSYDTTHYDFVVPVEHLREGVELLADLATHASFPPNEIENEKKYPERYRKAVEAVTPADVLRVAKQYLEKVTTVVLRPR